MCASTKPYICKLPLATAVAGALSVNSLCTRGIVMPNCEAGWAYLDTTGKCYKVSRILAPLYVAYCILNSYRDS